MENLIEKATAFLQQFIGTVSFEELVTLLSSDAWMERIALAGVFAGLGVIVGGLVVRPTARMDAPPADSKPPPTPEEVEKLAARNFRKTLKAKGISDDAAEVRTEAFLRQFNDLKDNLLGLDFQDDGVAAMASEAREVLSRGELRRAVNLLYNAADRDFALAGEKRAAAGKHLGTSAVAMALAGDLEMAQMEYEMAAVCYRRALESLPDDSSERLPDLLEKHGTASYHAGDHAAATTSFGRVLELQEKTLGEDHAELATSLNSLALVHYVQGDFAAAEPLYQRALKIDENTFGAEHPSVATDLNNLGLLYKKQENLEAAEPMFKRSLAIKEKVLEPGDPSLVAGLKNYAALLRAMGRADEAEAVEAQAPVAVEVVVAQ